MVLPWSRPAAKPVASRNLPRDIILLILEHVSTDTLYAPATRHSFQLLCNTSLVSRCWRNPCQTLLWQHLSLRIDSDEPAALYFSPALGHFSTESLLLEQLGVDSSGEEVLEEVLGKLVGLQKLCISAVINLNSDLFHIPSLYRLRSLTILDHSTFTPPDPTLVPISFRLASLHVWDNGRRPLARNSILSKIIEASLLSLLDIQLNVGNSTSYLRLDPKIFDAHTRQLPWRRLDLRHFLFDFRPLLARCTRLTQLSFGHGNIEVIKSWLSIVPSRIQIFKVHHVEIDGDAVIRTLIGSAALFNPIMNSICDLLEFPALEDVKLCSIGIIFVNLTSSGRLQANKIARALDAPLRKDFMERGILLDLFYR